MDSNKNYGENISRIRVDHGFTQKKLAEEMGISPTLITDYERGKLRLHSDVIVKLSEVLNVSADEILGLDKREIEESGKNELRLMKRVKKLEALPEAKKKVILKTLDDLIKANS